MSHLCLFELGDSPRRDSQTSNDSRHPLSKPSVQPRPSSRGIASLFFRGCRTGELRRLLSLSTSEMARTSGFSYSSSSLHVESDFSFSTTGIHTKSFRKHFACSVTARPNKGVFGTATVSALE